MSVSMDERRVLSPERPELALGAEVTGMAFLDGGTLAIAGGAS